jgi:putative oxygen-independent coproporphyrinogen III oxidase
LQPEAAFSSLRCVTDGSSCAPGTAPTNEATLPLSLYVHLPWCTRKCPYCDFNSFSAKGGVPERRYVDALLRDLEIERESAGGRPIRSVYIGGGTPSLFSGASIARLLDGIRAALPLGVDVEITLEANPGSADAGRFAAFRTAGVNRLSIGVQSFRAAQLAALGRVHGPVEAFAALECARSAGFTNVNIDLMYGLPGDAAEGSLGDLESAIALEPAHISWYQLTLEPNTAFERRPPPLPHEDAVAETEERGRAMLARSGYRRYEISAFARAGHECAHNLNYWAFGDYLGVGAGAHGKLSRLGDGYIERRARARNPQTYMDTAGTAAAVAVERVRSGESLALEFMMNALRLTSGVACTLFEARTALPVAAVAEPIRRAALQGWLIVDEAGWRPTAAGLQALNRMLLLFCTPLAETERHCARASAGDNAPQTARERIPYASDSGGVRRAQRDVSVQRLG